MDNENPPNDDEKEYVNDDNIIDDIINDAGTNEDYIGTNEDDIGTNEDDEVPILSNDEDEDASNDNLYDLIFQKLSNAENNEMYFMTICMEFASFDIMDIRNVLREMSEKNVIRQQIDDIGLSYKIQ